MLRYMTAGESHGKGVMAILDGMPAGLKLDEKFVNWELRRRMHGYGRGGRMAIEADAVELISGLNRRGVFIINTYIENKVLAQWSFLPNDKTSWS